MTQKWTPEPWAASQEPWYIWTVHEENPTRYRNGWIGTFGSRDELHSQDEHNAKRAVACVNACVGMSDPAAEINAMREVCEAAKSLHWDEDFERLGKALAALRTLTESEAVDDGHSQTDKCGDDCTLEVLRPGQLQCNHDGAKCPNKEAKR